ncbi:MAG: response regulator [Flavobacteriales bacterium]|nr:response regulator [Flavobacteriales bacterium]
MDRAELDNKTTKAGVLYVDDEQNNLVSFKAALRREFNVYTAIGAEQAEQYLTQEDLKVIISDQRMPDETGVEFFSRLKDSHQEPIRILLTGYSDMQSVVDAINKGEVYRYLTKPWDASDMISTIKQAIEIYDLRKENKRLMAELKRVNGQLEFYLRQKLLS